MFLLFLGNHKFFHYMNIDDPSSSIIHPNNGDIAFCLFNQIQNTNYLDQLLYFLFYCYLHLELFLHSFITSLQILINILLHHTSQFFHLFISFWN